MMMIGCMRWIVQVLVQHQKEQLRKFFPNQLGETPWYEALLDMTPMVTANLCSAECWFIAENCMMKSMLNGCY